MLSGGNELERKIDQRNQWMLERFLLWTHFTDLHNTSWGCLNCVYVHVYVYICIYIHIGKAKAGIVVVNKSRIVQYCT